MLNKLTLPLGSNPVGISLTLLEIHMHDRKPSIRMHFGALHDEVFVDGKQFDRQEFRQVHFRNIIIDTLLKIGFLKRRKKHA